MKKIYQNILFPLIKDYPAKTVIWVSLLIITVINISYENWNDKDKIIAWDVNSYYAYLPMVFIYHDMDMSFTLEDKNKFNRHYWPVETKTGNLIPLTSMGMAFLYSPFFLAGHGVAQFTDFAGDEFSPPYKIAMIISCLFYLAIGLLLLRRVLLKYYSRTATALTLLAILFGTNLLYYVTNEPTMTHAYSFALFSAFLFVIDRFFRTPNIKYALFGGALAGLITLVRPSNLIIIILLIFWNISSFGDLWQRILFYFKKLHLTVLLILAFLAVWAPQFIYWYEMSGSILLNTYGVNGGGNFFFNNPQFYNLLFSYRKGWLVYTPIMLFAIAGIYFLYKEKKKTFLPVFLFFLINLYVISSWWSWWYGGGFSIRSLIESYAIMAFPLAALITWLLKQNIYFKGLIFLLLGLLMYLNIFQTVQYKEGSLHFVAMTKTSYWAVFLDMTPPHHYWTNLVYPDMVAARQGIYYPETEIPYGFQQKIGMEGREYLEALKNSILNDPKRINIIRQNYGSNVSLDSLIDLEAMQDFKEALTKYKEEIP